MRVTRAVHLLMREGCAVVEVIQATAVCQATMPYRLPITP